MTTQPIETVLQKEQRLFRDLFSRLWDSILNKMFDLRLEKAAHRRSYLLFLFFLSGFIISLYYYPPSEWTIRIGNILNVIRSESSTAAQLQATVNELLNFFWIVVKDARILQYIPIFLAPFFIALQSAAIYLADIFELEDVSVARKFITSVALGGSDATIYIQQGEIAEESRKSPAFLIGGPGKVVVALDSVALFEGADGTPHVIGPTGKEPGSKATLDGFERFRQAFDLRDHFIELRDQNDKASAVKSRSLDGIPVKAVDVRFMFSVFRGENPQRTDENPYPFVENAVKDLVYKAASRATPGLSNPSTFEPLWRFTMAELIRKRLGDFMSLHQLTEYLASIGAPEVEKARQREETIFREIQELTRTGEDLEKKKIKPSPDFYSRAKIRDLFARFANDFTAQAHESGVELHWIGVGTWEVPEATHPKNHLEAWKLTQDNLKNGSDDAMKKTDREAMINKMKEIIAKVPVGVFEQITDTAKSSKKAKPDQKQEQSKTETAKEEKKDDKTSIMEEMKETLEEISQNLKDEQKEEYEHKELSHGYQIQTILVAYRNQILEAIEFIRAKNEPVPDNLVNAVRYINKLISHWAGQ